jgi:phage/conjugal plasmid C-4 type zinc finger TraR family protein
VTVDSAVQRAKSLIPQGESLTHCEECEAPIPEKRRVAIPGVRLCIRCQSEQEAQAKNDGLYNRRGSKDSQLR